MPRAPRIAPPGYCYHVLNRAALRARIFHDFEDYAHFQRLLERTKRVVPIRLYAFCVMPNHWHLVVEPLAAEGLSRFIHRLASSHALQWRSVYGTAGQGAVYQGRFKAFPIQTDRHYLTVVRYVEQNPLRAGLVRSCREWRWSSFWWRTRPGEGARLLDNSPVPLPDDWCDTIDAPDAAPDIDELRQSIRRCAPFGDSEWQQKAATAVGQTSALRSRGRSASRGADHDIVDSTAVLNPAASGGDCAQL